MIDRKFMRETLIKGDACMLSKYGEVYNCIDNAYHPNPGSKDQGYPEIELCIDWCYRNNLVTDLADEFVKIRVANLINDGEDRYTISEEVFYAEESQLCDESISKSVKFYDEMSDDEELLRKYSEKDEIVVSEKIANFINENFLRVRAGGKLNPEGTDSIYFRISSHGYNWHPVIVDFLWEVFKSPDKMPKDIWIGHDAETNPPEVVLFRGSSEDLFDKFDGKIFESLRKAFKSDYKDLNTKRAANKFYSNFKKVCSKVKFM